MPVLAGVLLLTACDPMSVLVKTGAQAGGTVVEALVGQAGTLNPLFATDDNARDVDSVVYEGLTSAGADQSATPLLARSISVSADGTVYTLPLRSGVKWADGAPFGADDVLFTYSVLRDPAYQEPAAQFWKEVKVDLDPSGAVRFTLKAPSASFPFALRVGILPRHVFEGVPVAALASDPRANARAFGTGPFEVTGIASGGKSITLRRNPNARQPANLDGMVFRSYPTLADALDAVSRGEADAVGALHAPGLSGLERRADLSVREVPTYSFAAVMLNLSPDMSTFFNPPAVRQALVQAVDRRKVVKAVDGRADPAPGPLPPPDWAFDAPAAGRFPYDPVAARTTLDAAGWVLPAGSAVRQRDGREFRLSLVTADAYPYRQVADTIAEQLGAVGVQVTVDAVPPSVLVSQYLVGKKYQLALVAFDNGPDPDQYGLWHTSGADDPLNFASPLTPKQALIDKDLEDGRAAADRKVRRQAYVDFQQLMSEGAPAIFLYEPHYEYVVSRRIHDLRLNPVIDPSDRLEYAASWWVDARRS